MRIPLTKIESKLSGQCTAPAAPGQAGRSTGYGITPSRECERHRVGSSYRAVMSGQFVDQTPNCHPYRTAGRRAVIQGSSPCRLHSRPWGMARADNWTRPYVYASLPRLRTHSSDRDEVRRIVVYLVGRAAMRTERPSRGTGHRGRSRRPSIRRVSITVRGRVVRQPARVPALSVTAVVVRDFEVAGAGQTVAG
jgi:hypothetical protein